MRKLIKWLVAAIVVAGGLYCLGAFILSLIIASALDLDEQYSKQDLIDNYKAKSRELAEIKRYAKAVTPARIRVKLEFEGEKLRIFHVTANGQYDNNWDVPRNSAKARQLLQRLGWTQQTLDTLQHKLEAANCISIESGEPFTVGYQRSGMGMYFYNLFERPLPDSLRMRYNDGCHYILYKPTVALEYGAGAIGGDCFEGYQGGI